MCKGISQNCARPCVHFGTLGSFDSHQDMNSRSYLVQATFDFGLSATKTIPSSVTATP